jgi:MtrB/PioB family decaheme-associated outer membrane protein
MLSKLRFLILFLLPFCVVFPLVAQEEEAEQAKTEETAGGTEPEMEDEADTTIETTAGVWGNHFIEDSSKAEEYGEVPEGFLINSFKVAVDMENDRFLELRGRNVGLNNGQYSFDYGVDGKYEFYLDYSKIPHLFSRQGETIWTETSRGVWSLPDTLQQAIENLNPVANTDPSYAAGLLAQRRFISGLLTTAHPIDLRLQRNRTSTGFSFTPNVHWKYGVEYFLENRDGYRPFGTTFGFSWVTELPEHLDYDTQNFRASAQYSKNGRTLAVTYDLNLFNNEINRMIWDNPYRLTDRTYDGAYSTGDATSRAQLQLAPDSTSNMLSVAGATKVGKRGRFTGSLSYAMWNTEVDLLPFTVNTAIPVIPLPASTFNGEQNNLNLNLRYNTLIGSKGDFTANFRMFDHNNNNDRFNIGEYVRLDAVEEPLHRFSCDSQGNCVEVENPPTHLFAFSNNTFDLDFGWRLGSRLRWFAGYQFDRWNREERDTDQTDTNRFKTGIDYRGTDWMSLNVSYLHARRRSDEFDVDNPVAANPAGQLIEYLPLRRYDEANLNQNLFRAMVDFLPGDKAAFGVSFVLRNNEYVDTIYGIQQWDDYSIGLDFSYAFTADSTLNAWYEHAENDRDQRGRQTGAVACDSSTQDCTIFDWTINLLDKYNTFGAGYSRNFQDGKTSWNTSLTYSMADGNADFAAINEAAFIAANRRGPILDITAVDDTDLFTLRTGINCRVFRHAKIGVFYWYENYLIDDFAEDSLQTDLILIPNPVPGSSPFTGGTITLNAIQPDYEFHSGWVGFIFNW